MLTAEQRARLIAQQNGTYTNPNTLPPAQRMEFTSYPGCPQNNGWGQTQESVLIDPSQANLNQCGLTNIFIDRSSSSLSGTRRLVIGGGIMEGDNAIVENVFDFPSTPALFADEDASTIGIEDGVLMDAGVFTSWLNDFLKGNNIVFGRMDAESLLTTAAGLAAFATFKASTIQKRTVEIQGNWDTINPKISPVFCDPCLQDDGTHASWIGNMPLSARDLIALTIPAGLSARLDFCVDKYENSKNMTVCA